MSERTDSYPTRQGFAVREPHNDASVLRLTIICADCGALRTFEVTRALGSLLNREVAHMHIETGCEVCRHGIQVTLFWDMDGMGYAYKQRPEGETMYVTDANGLHVPMWDADGNPL